MIDAFNFNIYLFANLKINRSQSSQSFIIFFYYIFDFHFLLFISLIFSSKDYPLLVFFIFSLENALLLI
jgi:hypothetical protein